MTKEHPMDPAARILTAAFPQIADFDATGMTHEEIHYHLGESAAVAREQYLAITGGAR